MSKSREVRKENRKQPQRSLKEKRLAKQQKKQTGAAGTIHLQ